MLDMTGMKRLIPLLTAAVLLAAALYDERFRPQIHFSPARNWTNDPCGLVYAAGQYHLFFQYNPFGDQWGHMSWGRAVSSDLVHWKEMPVAIPEADGVMIFTGSSVVDERNSSGLCAKPGCIVSVYTGSRPKSAAGPAIQNQNLAFSNDGRAWTKYKGNPVLDVGQSDFRDPKVFWHAPSRQWIMVVMLPRERKAQFYASSDLKSWRHLSDFGPAGATGGDWECPDFYELPVDGDPKNTRWVLKIGLNPGHIAGGSGEQYFIGRFDGERFTNDNPPDRTLWLDYGRDCYCEFTFNNAPDPAKPPAIAWMNNWQYAGKIPTSPWRGQMTFPRTLALRSTPGGIRLTQSPAPALESLRADPVSIRNAGVAAVNRRLAARPSPGETYELAMTARLGRAQRLEWRVLSSGDHYTTIGYDRAAGRIYVDRTRSGETGFSPQFPSRTAAPLALHGGELKLRILVDRSSVEVFAGDGLVVLTNLVFPGPRAAGVSLSVSGGDPQSLDVQLWNLRSIWSPRI
jgi:fructan beta-fructosidase